jgi:TolB protein
MRKSYSTLGFIFALLLIIVSVAACSNDEIVSDIAYVVANEGRNMFVLDRSGEYSKVINDSVTNPKWSPNQRNVAYLADAGGGVGQIMIWNREDGVTERLPDAPAKVEEFFWSPDSRMIAYQALSHDYKLTEVFVHELEGGENSLLASEPLGNVELGNWSGDNKWIVMRMILNGSEGIYKRSVHGVDEVQLTDHQDSRPRFSLDGKRVAFARAQADGSSDIYTLVVDAGNGPSVANELTNDSGDETDFEWSPDGRNIIFVTEKDGNPEIYAVETEKKTLRRLTQNRIGDADPKWSSDGSQILFRSDSNGRYDLFAMDFKSGAQHRIHSSTNSIAAADW